MNTFPRVLILVCLMVFIAALAIAQTTRIVDNNINRPTGANIYTSLQAAIDASSAGDIIHVVGSPTSYGDIVVTKRLSIYGIGLNPAKEMPMRSTVGTVRLQNTNTSNSSGSVISGLQVSNIYVGYIPTGVGVVLTNITIDKCLVSVNIYLSYPDTAPLNGLLVKNCIVGWIGVSSGDQSLAMNIVITNNQINTLGGLQNAIIKNCLLRGGDGTPLTSDNAIMRDCVIANNILYQKKVNYYGDDPGGWGRVAILPASYTNNYNQIERCTFSNNILYPKLSTTETLPPTGYGIGNSGLENMIDVDPQFADSAYYTPKTTSPAKNAGTDGTDIGLYGGTTPFDYIGSPLPYIQQMSTSVVPQGTNLKVTVRAKGVK